MSRPFAACLALAVAFATPVAGAEKAAPSAEIVRGSLTGTDARTLALRLFIVTQEINELRRTAGRAGRTRSIGGYSGYGVSPSLTGFTSPVITRDNGLAPSANFAMPGDSSGKTKRVLRLEEEIQRLQIEQAALRAKLTDLEAGR